MPLYVKELNPPAEEMCPRSEELEEYKNLPLIDHNKQLMTCDVTHIDKIIVYFGDYIIGIEVEYTMDRKKRIFGIMGTESPIQRDEVKLDSDEHIDTLTCYYNKEAITSIYFRTTKGKTVFFDTEIRGEMKSEVNLKDNCRAAVSFKGKAGHYLYNLWVCHEKIIRVAEEPKGMVLTNSWQ